MPEQESVDALVARGDYARAAAAAAAAGDLRRAITLYERIWRFADALPLALEAGDRPLAVRLAVEARDLPRARGIAASIPTDAGGELAAAAEAFARRGHHHDAAVLAERAGWLEAAAAYFQKAGAWLDAGRCLERAGRFQEAGRFYEWLAGGGQRDGSEAAAARLALGRLLGSLGRHREAARALQAAAREPSTAGPARRRLVAELLALGYEHAAEIVARRVRDTDPIAHASALEIARAELQSGGTRQDGPEVPRRFRVVRPLGGGALGRVYAAEDQLLGRTVALKVLAAGAGLAGPERQAFQRFLREAEAAGRLRHPNIVAVHDIDEGAAVLVLEYLPGGTLAEALARTGALTVASARRLGLELCAALSAAHGAGIVHRDVKPPNVFFDAAGNAKLGDFGAAHLLDFGQTQTGGFIGTLAYLAPEQITGSRVGPETDVYALGATLYEALTGRPPFLGPDLVGQHLGEPPPPPSELRPDLGPEHDHVLLRALAKAPESRFSSATALAEALAAWSADTRPAPRAEPAPATERAVDTTRDAGPDAVPLGRTARGTMAIAVDARVGRRVLVETLEAPLDDEGRAALRALAARGGPHVQRVLGLDSAGRTITYELVEGEELPLEALTDGEARTLAALGVPFTRAVRTPGGPVALVAPPASRVGDEELRDE